MKKNDKKKPVKQGKKKTFKLDKRSSSSGDSKKMRVAVGAVGVGAALLGLAYIQTISPMLRKKKIEAEEAKLQSQINETVRGRIAEKAESVKARALNLADIKVLAESYSAGTSRSTTPKTSPTVKIAPVVLQEKTKESPASPKASTFFKTIKSQELVAEPPENSRKFSASNLLFPLFTPQQKIDNQKVSETQIDEKKRLQTFSLKSKNFIDVRKKLFTKKQKNEIVKILEKRQDPSKYISEITGTPYIPAIGIRLTEKNSIDEHLYLIQERVLNTSERKILEGLEKIREKSRGNNTVHMLKMEDFPKKDILETEETSKPISFGNYSPKDSGFEKIYKKSTLKNKLDTLDILEKMEAHTLRLSEKK